MTMVPAPFRFLLLVLGSWLCVRGAASKDNRDRGGQYI